MLRIAGYCNAKLHSVTQVFPVLIVMKGIQLSELPECSHQSLTTLGLHHNTEALAMFIKVAVGSSLTDFVESVAVPFCSHFQASCRLAFCFSLLFGGERALW